MMYKILYIPTASYIFTDYVNIHYRIAVDGHWTSVFTTVKEAKNFIKENNIYAISSDDNHIQIQNKTISKFIIQKIKEVDIYTIKRKATGEILDCLARTPADFYKYFIYTLNCDTSQDYTQYYQNRKYDMCCIVGGEGIFDFEYALHTISVEKIKTKEYQYFASGIIPNTYLEDL